MEKSINTPSFAQLVMLFDASWDGVCPPGSLLTAELLPTMNLRSLSAGLLSSYSFQGLNMCLALLGPRCRNWNIRDTRTHHAQGWNQARSGLCIQWVALLPSLCAPCSIPVIERFAGTQKKQGLF